MDDLLRVRGDSRHPLRHREDIVKPPGNVNDSNGAVDRPRFSIEDVRQRLGGVPIEIRLDGVFCQETVLELLTIAGVEYVMRMPIWQWLGIGDRSASREAWGANCQPATAG